MPSIKPSIYVALIFAISLFSCQNIKKEQFNERDFISLAGEWQSNLGTITLPGSVDERKLAPRTKDTLTTGNLTRLHPYEGVMRYEKEIEIPSSLAHKEWRLIMERTKPSTVWIDGDSIGSSSVILSPQIYNLGILSAGKHRIIIQIDNSPQSVPKGIHGSHAWTDATQTNWNGIIGKFGLEANDGLLIESLQVYPSTSSSKVPVKAKIASTTSGKASILIKGYTWNTEKNIDIPDQTVELTIKSGLNECEFEVDLGKKTLLWSEFDPALYKVNFELNLSGKYDTYTLDFGVRDFSTQGTQFTINSLKTFLRGKHDACVFPLTGYPPMEKEEWKRQFRIAKQYGINHYRFHSWTPPQAAFDAANEEGIYMQPELPFWGVVSKDSVSLNEFLIREGEHILATYGNNPSFVMMALGNELGGDVDYMCTIVTNFRNSDNRHLYAFGSNNGLGTGGQQKGEDFLVTCRVGGQVGSGDYSTHTRTTFSFADAVDGGYMNALYPSSNLTFSKPVADCSVPIISHENGQFQSYPDYDEIKKYTGVLYPYNLEIFRQRLTANGLLPQAKEFHQATTRFAALCYKADIEMCFRTAGFGGFQVLDLQDFPGQGSAYVGILNAFMENKGGMTAEEFNGFCDEIVPMSLMPKYCWDNTEIFTSDIVISNYSKDDLKKEKLEWVISKTKDKSIISKGTLTANVNQGDVTNIGKIEIPLNTLTKATQLQLSLKIGNHQNQYNIWVYPNSPTVASNSIKETKSLNDAIKMLSEGKTVLYTPNHKEVEKLSVGGLFTPDYWNYAMFKGISEWLKREVSPGTLSVLTNPDHPLFKDFPTEAHSNWQWWIISKNSRPFILDNMPREYRPLVQVVDNIERNHRLGMLFELNVGKGKLLVSMCNLDAIKEKPEGKQFYASIINYMASSDFKPKLTLSVNELRTLFNSTIKEKEIIGVKNITTYQ